jgi:hypothetical protein
MMIGDTLNPRVLRMTILPVFVDLDYRQNVIQVCVMVQFRKILANHSVDCDRHGLVE